MKQQYIRRECWKLAEQCIESLDGEPSVKDVAEIFVDFCDYTPAETRLDTLKVAISTMIDRRKELPVSLLDLLRLNPSSPYEKIQLPELVKLMHEIADFVEAP